VSVINIGVSLGFSLGEVGGPFVLTPQQFAVRGQTGAPLQPRYVQIGKIYVDATLTDTPTFTVDITEHPVEAGANVSDHARARLEEISIEGLLGNFKLGPNLEQPSLSGSDFAAMGPSTPGSAEAARDYLIGLKQAPVPVAIVTPYRTYAAMLLKVLKLPRSSKYGGVIHFQSEWKEYNTVSTKKTPVQLRQAAPVKRGFQQSGFSIPAPDESLISKGFDAATGAVP